MSLKSDAREVMQKSIGHVLPGPAIKAALKSFQLPSGRLIVIAVGKAAFTMAKAADEVLGDAISIGLAITKYNHVKGKLHHFTCAEAGHPTPDENSFLAAEAALSLVKDLTSEDEVLFLISGGASALFEHPIVSKAEMESITTQLLKSGADIKEMNTVRKHLSMVKGGRFALACMPAHVHTIILSDVLGNDISMIGSGPTCPDQSTGEEAFAIIDKYHIRVTGDTLEKLLQETPKELDNVSFQMIGDVTMLCEKATELLQELGYSTHLLTDQLTCEAKEAGTFFGNIAKTYAQTKEKIAFVAGGETVVHVKGNGKGGRNQEMALACADLLDGLENCLFFSIGSDGTDGPTDAAGGVVDGNTKHLLAEQKMQLYRYLDNNDAYAALKAIQGLIVTGPTGTNVNDLSVLLINPEEET